MKTELTLSQLAAIGAGASQFVEGKALIGDLTVHPTRSGYAGDQPFREAFARAVRDAVLGNQTIATDPYAELKKAHAEGKVIQAKSDNGWFDVYDEPTWIDRFQWRIKPETFEAHGKTWTRHEKGDPMPCDGEALVEAWTPAVGDVVQLKSGGPKMTIAALSEQTSLVPCQWFGEKNPRSHAFPKACLTLVTE